MNKFNLLFTATPAQNLPDAHFSLLQSIWQRGQSLKKSKMTKDSLSKELNVEIREALIMDGAFLLVVSKDEERVYEIKQ